MPKLKYQALLGHPESVKELAGRKDMGYWGSSIKHAISGWSWYQYNRPITVWLVADGKPLWIVHHEK